MLFGSQVYGTSTPESDRDLKSVFIPAADEILFQRVPKVSVSLGSGPPAQRNTRHDTDHEAFSIAGYLKLLCEGQTVAVDMLFVPERFYRREPGHVWQQIWDDRDALLSRQISAFVGYCRTQASKYGIKGSRMAAARAAVVALSKLEPRARLGDTWPALAELVAMEHVEIVAIPHARTGVAVPHLDVCGRKAAATLRVRAALEMYQRLFDRYGERARAAERNEGIDWKALMHAVRVLGQARELLETGSITFPRPDAEELLAIRQGRVPYRQVAEQIEAGVDELPALQARSRLRERPDRTIADTIVRSCHLAAVGEEYFRR